MKLDIGSLAFNLNIIDGGGTPSWGTALGQNANHNYSVPGVEELLTSMVYCTIDQHDVYCPLGKGGSQQDSSSYELASLYKKVYANGVLIPDAEFVLLIVKKTEGDYHVGRRTLKYSPRITYKNQLLNEDCFDKIARTLGISANGAWLVYSLYTNNQDELHFDVIIADKNNSLSFANTDERKKYILDLLEKSGIEIGEKLNNTNENQKSDEQSSEHMNSDIDSMIYSENSIETFKNYYLSHLEDLKNDENEIERIKCREEFKREYPISRLRTLSIDEYALGTDNFKETLSYYLEFGKYRYAGPGIGGATSAKHGFYKRDDGNYYGIKNKPIDNPTEYWDAFKNQMADFYEECGKIDKPLRASSKYPLLQGMNMVLTKLLYVYYPNKYTNVCSKPKLRDLMRYFNYDFSNDMQAEELNFLLNKNIRADIPELSRNDPQYIGSALWKFVNELERKPDEEGEEVENDVIDVDSNRITGAYNKIVYGIPGCGKSFYVSNTIIKNDINKGSVFRTTFYPDYTNGDFVGQVIPKLNSKDETTVLYDIQSGPFADALLDAILNPNKNTYLIIEEINRGNAAAIFGDIFQLLDRNLDGTSEYPIKNYIISTFLHKKIDNKYSVYYDLDNIKIPSNLILIGTMNTSDQNVFTLDTAFKRRWKMEYIKNDINDCEYASYLVPMSNVTWAEFVNEINNFITSDSGLDINGEDKQIGSYFITGSEWNDIRTTDDSKEAARIFAEKVLSYIWDDVAKINRDSWFDSSKYKTLDSLVSAFMDKGLEVFSDNICFTREEDKD